ncbi:MAG: glycosyltransferase, partial [Cyanobacteria bacterium J06632_22]
MRQLFVASLLLAIFGFYVAQWNSISPTVFSPQQVNPVEGQPLPAGLPLSMAGLLLPLGAVLMITLQLRWLPVNNWTRAGMKLLLGGFAIHYFIWRTGTLNLSHWSSALLSTGLFINEAICFASMMLYLAQSTWTTTQRRRATADVYAADVESGRYQPSVDVLIPTYNEPDFIIRRTVIGCQAMSYANKKIYVLDDTRRPHIKALASELGCEYITRPNNIHAKAGNLNNALLQLEGELLAIMDADFVPFKQFLSRTVGFFQEPIALLQTQQNFYNPDYHARNLGLGSTIPNDLEHFYGHLQPARDVGNSVICCGTSYVARREALQSVGGYYTRCCVEDFQTSVLLLTEGHRLAYLNEMLSMGESTRTYADFIDQRLRWLQGNLQTFFCSDELHLWTRLNWVQKSYLLSQLCYCFQSVFRLVFLLTPLFSAYLGIAPLLATLPEFVYYFLPFMTLHIAVYGWSTGYRVSFFWNEIYETIFCFPGLRRVWFVLRNPFGKASRVTRKGIQSHRKVYNLALTRPLAILLGLSVSIILLYVGGYLTGHWPTPPQGSWITLGWLGYNSIILLVAILTAIDQPVRRLNDRFPLKLRCRV